MRQRVRQARAAVRVRSVVVALALAAMALHVMATAEHHGHEEEDEACPLCAAFSSEDDAVLPHSAHCLAAPCAEPAATALPTLLVARAPLPYSPRGPPKLCL